MTPPPAKAGPFAAVLQRFAVHAMATRFEIAIRAPFDAGPAAEAALEEIELVHKQLSRFERSSLVSHMSRTCFESPTRLEPDLFELFRIALDVEQATGGAFSPTFEQPGVLKLRGYRLTSSSPGPPIDLGAIAKGYALDLAARVLVEAGCEQALLHGGTSTALGIGGPFRVAVGDSPTAQTFDLMDAALSVSSQTRRDHEEDSYHVTDARSGRPADVAVQAVVLAPTGTLADAWSTAALALHPASPPSSTLDAQGVQLRFLPSSPSRS